MSPSPVAGEIAHALPNNPNAAIGIFDSGIGGLSVLRHVRAQLPHEDVLYAADAGFLPYGDKPEDVIVARSLAVAAFLMQRNIKAIVVACNTATAAAIKALRTAYPTLALVGIEPGLKPAAAASRNRIVGVLATEGTLASAKYKALREQIAADTQVRFISQPCVGLADRIERGEIQTAETADMIDRYVKPLLKQGADTLVLGCTHYLFVQPLIEECIARTTDRQIAIIDTGEAVTRQLQRLLGQLPMQQNEVEPNHTKATGSLQVFTTGDAAVMTNAFAKLLDWHPRITSIILPTPRDAVLK